MDEQEKKETACTEIFCHTAKDKTISITELLTFDTKRSKIAITMTEVDDSNKATEMVRHYVDAETFKLACHDILGGVFTALEDAGGNADSDYILCRVLSLQKQIKYRQPYVVRIDNGLGEVYGYGQIKMVRATNSLTMQMSEAEARRMALIVLDYIRAWEIIYFRKRQEARTVNTVVGAEEGGH